MGVDTVGVPTLAASLQATQVSWAALGGGEQEDVGAEQLNPKGIPPRIAAHGRGRHVVKIKRGPVVKTGGGGGHPRKKKRAGIRRLPPKTEKCTAPKERPGGE